MQGKTLGADRRHWCRAKAILYAWLNTESSLRTYGSKTDAYTVFRSMLESGNPPDNCQALLDAVERWQGGRGE